MLLWGILSCYCADDIVVILAYDIIDVSPDSAHDT